MTYRNICVYFVMEKQVYINGCKTDYSVTYEGVIYSKKYGKKYPISYNTINGGYNVAYLYIESKRYDLLVHRIVGNAFVENPENKPQINHIDGDKQNNCANNLQWVTQSENIKHAYDTKLMHRTHENIWNSLLNEDQVKEIRIMLLNKTKQRLIAKKFNVGETIISRIKLGKSYKGVGLIEQGKAIDINTIK